MKLRICLVIATATLLDFQPAPAQGTFVFNGGFDTNADGWVKTDIGIQGGWNGKGNPGGCFILDTQPSPSANPTISQTITGLIPGADYLLSGDYVFSVSHGGINTNDPSFGVSMGGVMVFQTPIPPDPTWRSFNVSVTATASSEVISLSSQLNNTAVSYIVDNIALRAVPEPSTLVLLGFGGITSVLRLRRKVSAVHG